MRVLDGQVHLEPGWTAVDLLVSMDAVGVAGALITNQSIYGPDNKRQLKAVREYPTRFALVAGVELTSQGLHQGMSVLAATPSVVGVRLVSISSDSTRLWTTGTFARAFGAANAFGLPICVYAPHRMSEIGNLCKRYPDTDVVLDHLNIAYNPALRKELGLPVGKSRLFDGLPDLLQLAQLPNTFVKLSAVPALSNERSPFADLWPFLHEIFSAFGPERIMWGSDWTIHIAEAPYEDSVKFILDTAELSQTEKEWVMSRTLMRVFRWPSNGH